jgi:tetratricopeptide (TPR) repeat protein
MFMRFIALIALLMLATPSGAATGEELNWHGNKAYDSGKYKKAMRKFSQALEQAKREGDKQYTAIAMYGLARASGRLCKLAEAKALLEKSIILRKEMKDEEFAYISQNILELGRIHVALSEWQKASEQYSVGISLIEALDIESSDPLGYAFVIEEVSEIYRSTGRDDEATAATSKVESLRKANPGKTPGYVSQPYPKDCKS